uniref:Uncharacterized protein n=1 Tax=Arundo donax TaxID=35708 RepID=A0A0A9H430_ARUDO
MLVMGTGVD